MSEDKLKQYEALLRGALKEIRVLKELRARYEEPIAIIGMSCRFPGACNTPEAYWRLICENGDAICQIPKERWDVDRYYDPDPEAKGKMCTREGGFISQAIDEFDARFFGLSPTEAIELDPQQRILLELAWEAFENSGYDPLSVSGEQIGTFIGLALPDYAILPGDRRRHDLSKFTAYSITGYNNSVAVGRLAHFFGLHGPALALDTACSSSLVAAHIACESIRRGDCDLALAGGITLNLFPTPFVGLSRMRALAPDGRCKTFEASADGYGRSEGAGIVVLKRLSTALRDGDRVLAVVQGSAVNQDGPSSGLTVPNGLSQAALLRKVLKRSGLSAEDISYLELHGTGTPLGDPIEVAAIADVLAAERTDPLYLGAVKKNIGHTECAAGVAGLIKLVLALQHKKIPPITVTELNPRIDLSGIPAALPQELMAWNGAPYAAVSAFGFGGTNAHLILAGAPNQDYEKASGPQIFTLSAKTPEALEALKSAYQQFLSATQESLSDIAYSANRGRAQLPVRLALVTDSIGSLQQQLASENTPELSGELGAIAQRFLKGEKIDWKAHYAGQVRKRVDLPNYPFERQRYWIDLATAQAPEQEVNALQGSALPAQDGLRQFLFQINLENLPEVLDANRSVHIGLTQEMLANALAQLGPLEAYTVHEMSFILPLLIGKEGSRTVLLSLKETDEGSFSFRFQSRQAGSDRWSLNIKGSVSMTAAPEPAPSFSQLEAGKADLSGAEFYADLDARMMRLGDSVQLMDQLWQEGRQLFSRYKLRGASLPPRQTIIPMDPGILDTCAQLPHVLVADKELKMMVSKIEGLTVDCRTRPRQISCSLEALDAADARPFRARFALHNEEGQTIAICKKFEMAIVTLEALKSLEDAMAQESLEESISVQVVTESEAEAVLLKVISELLTLPVEAIALDESLSQLGLDSIMAVSLRNELKQRLGADIALEEIVVGPSPRELLAELHKQTAKPATKGPSPWIVGQRKPGAKLRLFCLPYGGGGAQIYRDWQQLLPESIDVAPVQLPGREERLKEAAFTDVKYLIPQLADALEPWLDLPFALIGHSFGALVAYVLAKELSARGKTPIHLFASAYTSPALPNTRLKQIQARLTEPMETREQMRLVFPESSVIPDEVLPLYAKIGMADIKVVQSYKHTQEPLSCPITAFYGSDDETVPKEDMQAWDVLTGAAFKLVGIEGGHLFINDPVGRDVLLYRIRKLGEEL